eukprot:365219-Chlamydomonas_euryale.AAC.3
MDGSQACSQVNRLAARRPGRRGRSVEHQPTLKSAHACSTAICTASMDAMRPPLPPLPHAAASL